MFNKNDLVIICFKIINVDNFRRATASTFLAILKTRRLRLGRTLGFEGTFGLGGIRDNFLCLQPVWAQI